MIRPDTTSTACAEPAGTAGGDIASLVGLARSARDCRRCDLYKHATQVVVGEGQTHSCLVLVGEQPGDQEDRQGRPFVGPAGQLLDQCLREAELEREQCYVTNAVKHFKFERRGKRRIHERPNAGQVQACKWWLDRELAIIKPRLVVALGATAVQALLGRGVRVTKQRGQVLADASGSQVLITIHPSYLLRIPSPEAAKHARLAFIDDLRKARAFLRG